MNQNSRHNRRLIKDPLWGSIQLLSWEGDLISNPVVNRLHNIQQNSSAYKVYPALRVSRFSHSLGVMHVATQILTNAILESTEGIITNENRQTLEDEAEALRKLFMSEDLARIQREVQTVANRVSSDWKPMGEKLGHVLAIIRVCALLHDIGHLPSSHVGEFAIERMAASPSTSSTLVASWGPRLEKLRQGAKKIKVHEAFGKKLMQVLEQMYDKQDSLLASLISAAEAVLHSGNYPIVSSIVSSPIDADRIDFVRRDTYFSGLLASSIDYTRLFAFFQTRWIKAEVGQDPQDSYIIAPGSRAISEVEKLLWERFQDYKYIVCHHRVHLYDELVERCIVGLSEAGKIDEFSKLVTKILAIDEYAPTIPSFVVKGASDARQLLSLLTELDDFWLEMQFRREYAILAVGQPEARENRLWDILLGYIENRKWFVSAFKSERDFWQVASSHPEFDKLRQGSDEIKTARIKEMANIVNTNKYKWELEISASERATVIIGDLANRLSIGISGPNAAKQLELDRLYDFLRSKVAETSPFNFWYTSAGLDSRDGKLEHQLSARRQRIFAYICGEIYPQRVFQVEHPIDHL